MLDNRNKRKFQRISTNCSLSYRPIDGGPAHAGRCLNLSGSGVLFHGPAPAETGHAMEVTVLPDNRLTPPMDAFVEVTRCSRDGDGFEIAAIIKGIKGS